MAQRCAAFTVDEGHRKARRGVLRAFARVVEGNALIHVSGETGVETLVHAADHVDEVHERLSDRGSSRVGRFGEWCPSNVSLKQVAILRSRRVLVIERSFRTRTACIRRPARQRHVQGNAIDVAAGGQRANQRGVSEGTDLVELGSTAKRFSPRSVMRRAALPLRHT